MMQRSIYCSNDMLFTFTIHTHVGNAIPIKACNFHSSTKFFNKGFLNVSMTKVSVVTLEHVVSLFWRLFWIGQKSPLSTCCGLRWYCPHKYLSKKFRKDQKMRPKHTSNLLDMSPCCWLVLSHRRVARDGLSGRWMCRRQPQCNQTCGLHDRSCHSSKVCLKSKITW